MVELLFGALHIDMYKKRHVATGMYVQYQISKLLFTFTFAMFECDTALFRKMTSGEGVFPEDVAVAAVAAVIQNYS